MHRHRIRGALLAAGLGITALVAVPLPALGAGPKAADARPDVPGDELWAARYDGSGNGTDLAYALGVSPDGSKTYVTGASGWPEDSATVAYDSETGAQLWARRYDGPGNSRDFATALGVGPDASAVFVTGSSTGSTTGADFATVAYDADTGARLWSRRYDGPAHRDDGARALGVSQDGSTVVVTGYSSGLVSRLDYLTVAYDAATGARLWTRRHDGPAHREDVPNDIGVSADGSAVFVTGSSTGATGRRDYATVAYDVGTGAPLWDRRYDGPVNGYDSPTALGVSPDGSTVFVSGTSQSGTGFLLSVDYATLAYDSTTGTTLWGQRFGSPANTQSEATDLEVSPSGSDVFVTGSSGDLFGNADYATVSYEAASGALQWEGRYSGPASQDGATALGVSPDGSQVFVTGTSLGVSGTFDFDLVTVAHDASTGASLWERRYTGPGEGDDRGSALRVSPDGTKLFVTGRSLGSSSGFDYVTLAYSTT